MDKYTWRDRGSSYLPSEITAAFLCAQLDDIELVTQDRKKSWDHYQELMSEAVQEGLLTCPVVPHGSTPNGHIYYILLNNSDLRSQLISSLKRLQIQTTFHYVPLHSSPFGKQFRSDPNGMKVTELNSERLLRLPLWHGLDSISRNLIAHSLQLILKNK